MSTFLEELNALNSAAQQQKEQERQARCAAAKDSHLRGMAYALTILEEVKTELRKSAKEGWQSTCLRYEYYNKYNSSASCRDAIFATWPSEVNSESFARGIAEQLRKALGTGFNISLSVDEEVRPESDDDAIKISWPRPNA